MLFVFCFSFSFYFVSLSSPLCQSRTFLFFCERPILLSLSLSLLQHFSRLLHFDFIFLSLFSPSSLSLSFLFLVSPPIKIRLKTRIASLSKRPESVLEARRRASRGPELSPPVSPFPPVLYDGSSDCSRSRRVIRVRVRGPFRFPISRASFHRSFVSFIYLSFSSFTSPRVLLSFFAFYRSYFYNRTYGRANVGYVPWLLSRNRALESRLSRAN